ncbi:MAG: hypothetical protein ACOYUZ_00575 [Patescibacteria group bacterium]
MKNRFGLVIAVFAILSLALYGFGCNPFESAQEKAAEKMTEKMLESMAGEGVDVDLDESGGKVTIKDDEGGGEMTFGEEVELPSDLPDGVIPYPGAKAKSVIRNLGGSVGTMVTLTTNDSLKDVAEWYEDEYSGAGWEKTQTMSINDSEMRGFEKDAEQVFVTIGKGDGDNETIISINWSAE